MTKMVWSQGGHAKRPLLYLEVLHAINRMEDPADAAKDLDER